MFPCRELPPEVTGRVASIVTRGVRVREYRLWPGYRMSDHAHPVSGVVLQLHGRFRVRIDSVHYDIEPGRALVLPEHVPHSEAVGAQGAACLLLERVERRSPDRHRAEPSRVRPVVLRDARLIPLAHRLSQEITPSHRNGGARLHRIACSILDELANRTKAGRTMPGWVVAAWESAQEEPARWTVRELARSVGVAPESLSRAFVAFFGVAPSDCLRANRLEEAARRLEATDQSISRIAYDLGFVDQSHLTNAFKRRFATTPAAFRSARAHGA